MSTPPATRTVRRLLDVAAWGALLLFVVVTIGPSLLGRSVFLGVDVLDAFDPWASVDPAPPTVVNSMVGDTVDAVVPRTVLVAESLRAGDWVQWNPYTAGGAPVLPLPDNAPFSPLTLPWYLVPHTYAPGLVKLLEVVTVAAGMVLLARRWRLPSAAGAVATLAYVSSGFMVAWTNWQQTRVAAFVPLLFWAVERAVVERRARDAVPLALVVAAMTAGGFPAVLGWALYAAAAYAVVRALALRPGWRDVLRAGAVTAGGVVTGALLLAWQLLPFASNTLAVVDRELRQQGGSHLEWTPLTTTVVAEMLGGPEGERWATRSNAVEYFSYVGVAVVALVLVAVVLWRPAPALRGVKGALVGLTAATGVLVYVGGPPLALAQMLPVFDNSFVGRMRFLLGFLLAVLAGAGYARLVAPLYRDVPGVDQPAADTRPVLWRRLVLAGAVGAALLLVAMVVRVLEWVPPDELRGVVTHVLVAAGLAVASLVLVLLAVRRGRTAALVAGVVLPLLVAAPAAQVGRIWWPTPPVEDFYPVTATHAYLREHLGDDRFITVDQTMLPGSSTLYGLRAADGHAFHAPAWLQLLRAADPAVVWGGAGTYTSLHSETLDRSLASPVLDRIAVRYAVLPPGALVPGEWESGTHAAEGVVELGDGAAAQVTGRVVGPLAGVAVHTPGGLPVGPDGGSLSVELRDERGRTVGGGERVLAQGVGDPALWIAVTADVADDQEVEVVVRAHGMTRPVEVAVDEAGDAVLEVRRVADGLRVVSAGEATVVERLTALPRVRWASAEVVLADPDERVAAMAAGRVDDDAVVLHHEADAVGTRPSSARVEVVEDGTDVAVVEVDADGDGWLVVADSMQGSRGWSVTVDGAPAELVDAEHASGAVLVPAGRHTVRLAFTTPGARTGAAASAVGLVLLAGAAVAHRVPRPRRRASGTTAASASGQSASNDVPA